MAGWHIIEESDLQNAGVAILFVADTDYAVESEYNEAFISRLTMPKSQQRKSIHINAKSEESER